jgi:xylulokinase
MNYLLGIDIGTSGTKSALFDVNGKLIAASLHEYPLYQPQNGWAEQNPEDWWNAVVLSCRDILSESGIDPKDILGVGLSGQMHGLVMLDADDHVIRRSIIWCDQRTAEECDRINTLVGAERLLEISANPALTGFTASKILWVRNHEPENYARCKKILLPKDYIRFKLTGKFATEVSDASGMQLLDVRNRCWSMEILEKLDIEPSLLGKLFESPEVTGQITPEASAVTGLAEGTAVVGGAGDNAASAVGMGVVEDGSAFVSIGTSGVVYAHTSQMRLDPQGRVHTFCCAVPGEWHVMGVTQAAGLSLQWFRNNFCSEEILAAREKNIDPYELMTGEASNLPIGSNRLLYLPYLMGERTPHLDPDCRGVLFGLSASHERSDLIRAVMEGVSFSVNDSVRILREMGVGFDEILATGGGGKSVLWRSMMADIFNCEINTVSSYNGPTLGVAILAGVGVGLYASVKEACGKMIQKGESIKPDEENHEKYVAFYSLYCDLYPELKNSFRKLAQIGLY